MKQTMKAIEPLSIIKKYNSCPETTVAVLDTGSVGLGATHVINSTKEDVKGKILEITDGKGVMGEFGLVSETAASRIKALVRILL